MTLKEYSLRDARISAYVAWLRAAETRAKPVPRGPLRPRALGTPSPRTIARAILNSL